MKYSVIFKQKGLKRIYYHLKDENDNKYFCKKIVYSNDNEKMMNEVKMLQLFSEYDFVPKLRYYDFDKNIIIYEYIEGENLKNKVFDIDFSVNIILQVCNILKVIHQQGYIFGDLKSSNIMLGKKIMLIDYECVTKLGKRLKSASKLYCSPYQRINRCAIYQFDFYSLGMVFLELLIGFDKLKYYFNNDMIKDVEPNKIIINLPIEINNIIKKLLSNRIEDNYKKIEELLTDLQNYIKNKE